MNWSGIRASAKAKVVSFKSTSGWKRARSRMSIYLGGNVYDNTCSMSLSLSLRNPSPSGWKNRKSLKQLYRWVFTTKKQTKTGELSGTMQSSDGGNAGISIN